MSKYHVLLVRSDRGSPWEIAFGAFDLGDVLAERDDYRDHDVLARDLKIIHCGAAQSAIDARVDALNAKLIDDRDTKVGMLAAQIVAVDPGSDEVVTVFNARIEEG